MRVRQSPSHVRHERTGLRWKRRRYAEPLVKDRVGGALLQAPRPLLRRVGTCLCVFHVKGVTKAKPYKRLLRALVEDCPLGTRRLRLSQHAWTQGPPFPTCIAPLPRRRLFQNSPRQLRSIDSPTVGMLRPEVCPIFPI